MSTSRSPPMMAVAQFQSVQSPGYQTQITYNGQTQEGNGQAATTFGSHARDSMEFGG